jgi:hypothetical protein
LPPRQIPKLVHRFLVVPSIMLPASAPTLPLLVESTVVATTGAAAEGLLAQERRAEMTRKIRMVEIWNCAARPGTLSPVRGVLRESHADAEKKSFCRVLY